MPTYEAAPHWPELPRLHDVVEAAAFPDHTVRWRNDRAAAEVGLDGLTDEAWVNHFGRFQPLPDNLPQPLALRYHGHQFGHYNQDLGDGRGFLFAQCRDGAGRLLDLATKGSGTTPYSRNGDGRLTLQGAVREVLAAELLEARGVDTCRILSLIETGEDLVRYDEPSPTRSCVLVRLSHSHVRIGTFQRLAFHGDAEGIEALVDYTRRHLLPDAIDSVALLRVAGGRLLDTCAAWMAAGFVHGVLNTDNQCVTGESFDYGPWRFLEHWDADFTAAYFDEQGLYAFGRQPWAIGHGLVRLAGALAQLGQGPQLQRVLDELDASFHGRLTAALLRRLGLASQDPKRDLALAEAMVGFLETKAVPFDAFFWDWRGGVAGAERATEGPRGDIYRSRAFDDVRRALTGYSATVDERPLAGLVDGDYRALWAAIAVDDDWGPLHRHLAATRLSA